MTTRDEVLERFPSRPRVTYIGTSVIASMPDNYDVEPGPLAHGHVIFRRQT